MPALNATTNNSNADASSSPPLPNPVLTAYEDFVDKTSLVTRFILSAQFVSYLASWFVNPSMALSNSLLFTVQRYEVYRLLTSPIVNTSLFSLVFAFVSFLDVGKRQESRMGSAAFLWLCLALSLATNVVFLAVSATMFYFVTNNSEAWLLASAQGIWLVLFGITSMDCMRQHEHDPSSKRRFLFGASVPTKYYPIALYVVFSLLNADPSVGYLISMALGYGLGSEGQNILPAPVRGAFLVGVVRVQNWEETTLRQLASRPGYITGSNASGITISSSQGRDGGGMMGLPLFQQSTTGAEGGDTTLGTTTTTSSASSGGRTLGGGGAAHRRAADTRAARLQALEGSNKQQAKAAGSEQP